MERNQLPFSKITQIGIVVRDIEKAISFFESLNIGPFRPLGTVPMQRKVYGKPADDVKNLVRVTQIGQLQIELLQPLLGESVQKEFLETKGEGLNHLATFVNDIDSEIVKLEAIGFKVISGGKYQGGGGFAYFDTGKVCGVTLEIVQLPPNLTR